MGCGLLKSEQNDEWVELKPICTTMTHREGQSHVYCKDCGIRLITWSLVQMHYSLSNKQYFAVREKWSSKIRRLRPSRLNRGRIVELEVNDE